jgi:hypothetical protein
MIEPRDERLPENLSSDEALERLVGDEIRRDGVYINFECETDGGDSMETYPHIRITVPEDKIDYYRPLIHTCFKSIISPRVEIVNFANSFSKDEFIVRYPNLMSDGYSDKWVENQEERFNAAKARYDYQVALFHYNLHKGVDKEVVKAAGSQPGYPIKVSTKEIQKIICNYTLSAAECMTSNPNNHSDFFYKDEEHVVKPDELPSFATKAYQWGKFCVTLIASAVCCCPSDNNDQPDESFSSERAPVLQR